MTSRLLLASFAALAAAAAPAAEPRESRIPVGKASLYAREIGRGQPIIVLHRGPDFDHSYLLPELDQLADKFRLIYYDQRGRGRSAMNVQPEDVTLASDVDDIDKVRRHFHLKCAALLGHSWDQCLRARVRASVPGTRVSNRPHESRTGVDKRSSNLPEGVHRETGRRHGPAERDRGGREGDPDTVTARYRLHFKPALARRDDYEKLIARMHTAFASQGNDGILKARAVEDRLMQDTWGVAGWDLLPKLRTLSVPTLVITGDRDFIPAEIAKHIANAIPQGQLVTLKDCGHFSYMECPDVVRDALNGFFNLR